jgi:DNA polymerase
VGEPVDLECRRCPLAQGRTQVVAGKGPAKARLVIVGEAPGADEDRLGEPFVGRAGKLLDRALAAARVDRREVFVTNVVKCRLPGNRKPTREEQDACRPFLEGELEGSGARVALALGATAAAALVGAPLKVSEGAGGPRQATVGAAAMSVFPTLHPAAARFRKGAVETIAQAASRAAQEAGLERGA